VDFTYARQVALPILKRPLSVFSSQAEVTVVTPEAVYEGSDSEASEALDE
jgi:hypothetical protein